ncbi:MAG: hypothetical protein KIT31_43140, partial [Deltaproteobacteria bacterium]|nr:hypothetical protein [Deltaproteobacteria bacterium]
MSRAVAAVVALVSLVSLAGACSAPRSSTPPGANGANGANGASGEGPSGTLPDGAAVTVAIANGAITGLAPAAASERWLWPPVIDSHVHVAYWDVAARLPAAGIAAVVDLA